MNPSSPTAGTSVYAAIYAANSGMTRSEKALDQDADKIASSGGTVESLVDAAIQPEVFAASARVVKSTNGMTDSSFDVLA